MKNFIECVILYEKAAENGCTKLTKEVVVVKKALTLGEAESLVVGHFKPFSQGDTQVVSAREKRYAESITTTDEECCEFYETKVDVITTDENSGKEKHTQFAFLVQAKDIDDAKKRFDKHMKDYMLDYTVVSVKKTKITEIYG